MSAHGNDDVTCKSLCYGEEPVFTELSKSKI